MALAILFKITEKRNSLVNKNILLLGDIVNKVTKVMLISFFSNIFLSVLKIIFGIIGSAGALIADGFHSLSDMITDIFGIIGIKISKRPADFEHPNGHGNAEYITCMFIGFMVFIMGITIIYNGIFDVRTIPSIYTIIVTIIAIFLKFILSTYLIRKGKQYQSTVLISSGKESFGDVFSSFVVLISVILSQFSNKISVFTYCDMIAMILVGILILKLSVDIIKENISNLLGRVLNDKEYIKNIKTIIKQNKEIKSVDKVTVIKEGPFYKVNIQITMSKNLKLKPLYKIIKELEENIKKYDSKIIIIHINPFK